MHGADLRFSQQRNISSTGRSSEYVHAITVAQGLTLHASPNSLVVPYPWSLPVVGRDTASWSPRGGEGGPCLAGMGR